MNLRYCVFSLHITLFYAINSTIKIQIKLLEKLKKKLCEKIQLNKTSVLTIYYYSLNLFF